MIAVRNSITDFVAKNALVAVFPCPDNNVNNTNSSIVVMVSISDSLGGVFNVS